MSGPEAQPWRPKSFDGFVIDRLLSQDANTGNIAVLGSFAGHEGRAVVRLSRQHFAAERLPQLLGAQTVMVRTELENDIYSKFEAQVPADHAFINVDIVHPCTDKHVQKAEDQAVHMVVESPAAYRERTLPYISSLPPSQLQWVANILERRAEAERQVFEDPDATNGFMLHADLKWDQKTTDQLYCVALCHRRDVPSLRSLTAEHLPLLHNIRRRAAQEVCSKWRGVDPGQLRMFIHYPPSYYHFHVHITHVKAAYGMGAAVGKAHLLDDIIDNIETFGSDYYARRTLTFAVGENDDLWKIWHQAEGDTSTPAA